MFRRTAYVAMILAASATAASACGGASKGTGNNPAGALPDAIDRRDAGAVVAGLGGDPSDPASRAAADMLLRSLPKGTTMRLGSGSATTHSVTYEITVPGSAARQVSFIQIQTADGLMLLPAETGP